MSRPKLLVPSLRTHAPTGQAVVRIDGKDHYLGKAGTERAQARYDALIAEWITNGRQQIRSTPGPGGADLSIAELGLAWFRHVDEYYRQDGEPTEEPAALKLAFRPLRRLYGLTPARDFSPLKLKAVRDLMIKSGLSRPEINRRIGRILRMFRWGVSEELIPDSVLSALKSVEGLKKGRGKAAEPEPILPVKFELVEATLPYLTPPVRAIVGLLVATGARTKEICHLRTGDVDMTGEVWRYIPGGHKNDYRGMRRVIYIGPRGQEILGEWLKPDNPWAFLFSPREAMQARWAEQRARRKTKVQPSQESRKKSEPGRTLSEKYRTRVIHHAIEQGIIKANKERAAAGLPELDHWHPLQIRHAVGTKVRARYGIEAAQVILGHAKADVTQVYAERDEQKAIGIIAKIG